MPTQLQEDSLSNEEKRFRQQWLKSRASAIKHLMEGDQVKRQQIDTWAVLDDLGLTPYEFRLLYCIARHEKWKTVGRKKQLDNGCYASAAKLQKITGISRNKIFETLEVLQEIKLIEKVRSRGKKGRTGTALAGWTNEYRIMPISQWLEPWEIKVVRKSLKQRRKSKLKSKTDSKKK